MNPGRDLRRITVLHILDRSIPNLSGYSIRSKYIVEFQAKMGIVPIVVTTPKYDRETQFERINDVDYHRSYIKPSGLDGLLQQIPFVREKLLMRQAERKIAQLVQTRDVDIIHAHSPSLCGLPALNVAKRYKMPIVYEVRAFWEDAAVDRKRFTEKSLKYKISTKIEQRLFDRADAVVAICEGLRKEIANRTSKSNLFVVPNGVDCSHFKPRQKTRSLIDKYGLHGKVVVGFIGSFFTFEGLADLIKSVPSVINEKKDVAFLFVGAGVEDKKVRAQAEKFDVLGKSIVFTGRVPHDDVQDYYSIIDILVYPRISKRITELVTPLKPLEAMAMEKAVLVSNVGGLLELVKEEQTGFVFNAGDVNDLAMKLVYMVKNQGLCQKIGRQARRQIVVDRDWSVIVRHYLEIYAKLLSRN